MEHEREDSKKIVAYMMALAGLQTFFMSLMGAIVVLGSAAWVLLICILLSSLVNLFFTFLAGGVLTRALEAVQDQNKKIETIKFTMQKMLRRPQGLMDPANRLGAPVDSEVDASL